jgi:hypothetical protein
MKRFVITEDEKKHISKIYGLINENMIKIPKQYGGVRVELGNSSSPEDIMDSYNTTVEEGTTLVSYSDGVFYNENDEEITLDVVLDELNYAINGDEDEDYYDSPVKKTGRVSDNEFVFSDSGIDQHKITFNPKFNTYEFRHSSRLNGSSGMTVLTDELMKSLLDFLTKRN